MKVVTDREIKQSLDQHYIFQNHQIMKLDICEVRPVYFIIDIESVNILPHTHPQIYIYIYIIYI